MKRLPRITAFYWLLIISANTIGESGGDLLSMTFGFGYAASTIALIAFFLLAALVAVATRTQHPALYWTVIILSSTAGTTLSDYVTRTLHLGYGYGSLSIVACLAVTFVLWRLLAPRETVDTSLSRTAEMLYWAAILFSSTLGTAFGDYLADENTGLAFGFVGGTLTLSAVLAAVALLAILTPTPRALCYWLGIIVTHPLGATLGDTLTKDKDEGGVGLGTIKATLLLTAIFLAIVILGRVLGFRKKQDDAPPSTDAPPPSPAAQ